MTVGVALRLLAVMVLWASCFPLIAGLCLGAFGAVFNRPVPRGARSWGLIALVGLGATSLGFLGMFHAAEFVSPGLATVIANAQPILTAILAHVFLRERLMALGKTGLTVGLIGIAAIAWPGLTAGDIPGYGLGIAYVVLAATGVSIGNIAIKRLTGQVDAIMAMGFQLLIGAAPLALLSILTEDVSSLTWSADFALVLVVLAVFGSSFAFWLWFAALEQVDLNRANSFTFLVPIFGLAIGAALFEERLAWIQVAGVVLVLAGIILVQRDAPERTRR